MSGTGPFVRLLGDVELLADGVGVSMAGNKQRVALAVLAARAGQPVSVEYLAAALWSDRQPDHPRRATQMYVGRLRALPGCPTIATVPAGYRLELDPDAVDLHRFRRLVAEAEALAEPAARRDGLAAALALVLGRPFGGLESPTVDRELRPALEEEILGVRERRVDLDLDLDLDLDAGSGLGPGAAGSSRPGGGLVAELRALADAHPVRETLWLRLLRALDRRGRRGDALAAYEVIRRRLRDELGTDPGEPLRRLHHDLLAVGPDVTPATVPVAAPKPRPARADRGERAVETYRAPRQLPPDLPELVGRERELERLDDLIDRHTARDGPAPLLIVVSGPGGVGKSALAVRAAHRAAERFPDGQLYLNLRGAREEPPLSAHAALGILLRTMRAALGLPNEPLPDPIDERAAGFRSTVAGRRVLLLLDDAMDAAQVRPLVPASQSIVLVTSRDQLRGLVSRDGAHRLELGPLDRAAGARLLIDREPASSERPSRRTSGRPGGSDDVVDGIVELCSGFPLALRVARERIDRNADASPAQLLADLRDERSRLGRLAVPGDPASDLRAVFSWSYRALDPRDAVLFRRLGLHPPEDPSGYAAAALADVAEPEARQRLDRLVSRHLLQRRDADRYGFHDLVRLYAAELAEADPPADRAAARLRMFEHYLQTAMAARRLVRPSTRTDVVPTGRSVPIPTFAGPADALAWYDRERAGLIAVVRQAIQHGHATVAWHLAWATGPLYRSRHDVDGALEILGPTLDAVRAAGDVAGEYHTLHLLAIVHQDAGRQDLAVERSLEALEAARGADDPTAEGLILTSLGNAEIRLGRVEDSIRSLTAAIPLLEREDPEGAGAVLLDLGAAHILAGHYEDGIADTLRALTRLEARDEREYVGMALGNLGEAYGELGRLDLAVEYAERAVCVLRPIGARWATVEALRVLALARARVGDSPASERAIAEALEILERYRDPQSARLRAELDGIRATYQVQ